MLLKKFYSNNVENNFENNFIKFKNKIVNGMTHGFYKNSKSLPILQNTNTNYDCYIKYMRELKHNKFPNQYDNYK